MKKLSIIFIVMVLCSCRNLMGKHQQYVDEQNKGKFSVELSSPQFSAGESEAQFDSPYPFVPLRNVEVRVLYFPVEDAACLQYRVDAFTFHQFWDRDSREAFINGLEAYSRDFESQKLRKNSGRTRNSYGTVHGYLIWQTGRFTAQARGHIEMEIGYYFRERSPFYTVTLGDTLFVNYSAGEGVNRDMHSGERPMFFTKAQAAKIAECFDQEYLQSVAPEAYRNLPQRPNVPVEYDVY